MAKGLFLVLLMTWGSGVVRAADECVIRYDLVSKGITIGHAEATRSHVTHEGVEMVRYDVKTKVDVSLVFINAHIDGTESALVGPDGLVAFKISSTKDGKHLETSGAMTNGILHFVRVLDGVTNQYQVARTNYVATTLDGLELDLADGSPAVTNRVFDCARGETFDRVYRRLKDDKKEIAGKKRSCRVVEYSDDRKRGRRWVCKDEFGMAVFWQEAKEPSGSYSLRAREIITRPVSTAARPALHDGRI